jgi:hypothetical protein
LILRSMAERLATGTGYTRFSPIPFGLRSSFNVNKL